MSERATVAARSWRVSQLAAGLGTLGLAVDSLVGEPARVPPAQLIAIAVCAALWVWARLMRRSPSAVRGNLTFLLINAVIIVALTASAEKSAHAGVPWVPFRASHLGALTIALLAPPALWVGIVAIVAIIGSAVVQYAMFDAPTRAQLAYGDPWSTLIFGGFAMALLFYRCRADRIARDATRMQAEADDYHRFGLLMLAIRDLANTPLQTLMNVATLLKTGEAALHDEASAMERAIARLRELGKAMKPFDAAKPTDGEWNPKAVLGMVDSNAPDVGQHAPASERAR